MSRKEGQPVVEWDKTRGIRLRRDQYDRLMQIAQREDRSFNQALRVVLDRYFHEQDELERQLRR
jgi:hypothetical protein